jgi:hypothetical protein
MRIILNKRIAMKTLLMNISIAAALLWLLLPATLI